MAQSYGPFLLLKKLADGGMATTWLGRLRTDSVGQEVAIKRILPRLLEDTTFRDLFVEESRIATSLRHPHVVRTWDVGVLENEHYLAMEYLWGEDLRRIVERAQSVGKPLTAPMAVYVISRIARALHYVHHHTTEDGTPMGLVHRDVSPPNLMVTYDGEVKLIDFGIARAESHLMQVRQGQLKGKFAYMSPEQVQGLEVDGRSDLFSLGTLLYELTTGKRLFRADSDVMTIRLVSDARVIAPHAVRSDYPPQLEEIVMRALAREPRNRYQTGNDLADALDAWLEEVGSAPSREQLGAWLRELFPDHLSELHKLIEPGYSGPQREPSLPLPKESTAPTETPEEPTEVEDEPPVLGDDDGIVRDRRATTWFYAAVAVIVALAGAWLLFRTLSGDLASEGIRQILAEDEARQADRAAAERAPLEPVVLPGRPLMVRSEPAGAWVLVNGMPTGQRTPATVTLLNDRTNRVDLFLRGHESHHQLLEEASADDEVRIELQPLQPPEGWTAPEVEEGQTPDTLPMGKLRVLATAGGSRLEGARVTLNGEVLDDRTPATIRVPAGTPIHVMVEHPDYLRSSTLVTPRPFVHERDIAEVILELPPAAAGAGRQLVRLDTVPSNARIVDVESGEPVQRLLTLQEGEYRILRVQADEHEPALVALQAQEGAHRETIRLEAIRRAPTFLSLSVDPPETVIFAAQPQRGRSAVELGRGTLDSERLESGRWQITLSLREGDRRWRDRLELVLMPDTRHTLRYELTEEGATLLSEDSEPWHDDSP